MIATIKNKLSTLGRGNPALLYVSGLTVVLVIGSLLRVRFILDSGTDARYLGGLWVGFIEAIGENSYALPRTIDHVTAAGIPFSYPPLSFYVVRILADITGQQPLVFVNVLPGFVSILSIIAFFWLTAEFSDSKLLKFLGTSAFALLPGAYLEQQEPGGLAEAFGTLSLIVFAKFVIRLNSSSDRKSHLAAGLVGAITILASPGSAVALFLTVTAAGLNAIYSRNRIRQKLRSFLMITIVALIISSWYWGTVLAWNGPDIFVGTFFDRAGEETPVFALLKNFVLRVLRFNLGGYVIVAGITFAGLVEMVRQRRLFIPIWLLLLFAAPQESSWLVSIPGAIAIAYGMLSVSQVLISAFEKIPNAYIHTTVFIFSIGTLALWAIVGVDLEYDRLTPAQIQLMERANSFSTEDDLFLVVLSDSRSSNNFLEWFPFLAERTVLNESWGVEFIQRRRELHAVNLELQECATVSCAVDTYLLDEGDPESRRFLIVFPQIIADDPNISMRFQNESGVIYELPSR